MGRANRLEGLGWWTGESTTRERLPVRQDNVRVTYWKIPLFVSGTDMARRVVGPHPVHTRWSSSSEEEESRCAFLVGR